MNRNELCERVFKRAFYHAYNNLLLHNSNYATVVCVKYNHVFFFDTVSRANAEKIADKFDFSFVIRPNLPCTSERAKQMIRRLVNEDDKRKVKSYIDYFNDNDKFVMYDLYEELYTYFKIHMNHVYTEYVSHIINETWLLYSMSADFKQIIDSMSSSFKNDEILYPEQIEELLGFVLDNYNVQSDLNKSFNECRSNIIHLLTDCGLFDKCSD